MTDDSFTPIVVTTTSDNHELLKRIGESLVRQKLAACVQISGPITSFYRWQGDVESSQEWQCVIKTSRQQFASVESVVNELHHYDQPQLLGVPIVDGSESYLNWLRSSLRE